jgi:hypothetical protein
LGLVIDANADCAARWQALRDRLVAAGYQGVPDVPSLTGTMLPAPENTLLPRVGVWIMPDNQSQGMLEDFLRFLIPAGSRLFEHVQASVSAIPEADRRFDLHDEPKALIHTWLAWQEEPGLPYGTAIKARYLDSGVPPVDLLVSWLKNLFFC